MADYKYIDENVEFSGIKSPQIRTGQKITASSYTVDENGNIISNRPIINAIDIDWNNASSEDLDSVIKTTSDLLKILINIKNKVNNIKVPTSIYELAGGTTVLTTENFETIKEQLIGKSAYQIAKETAEEAGIEFPYSNERTWVASLKGERGSTGAPGSDGLSAYQIAKLYDDSIGTETEWVASLQGASAFQIAARTYAMLGKEFPYANEVEWMEAIEQNNANVETLINENVIEKISELEKKNTKVIGDDNHIKVICEETIDEKDENTGEVISYKPPYLFKVIGENIASATSLDSLILRINSIFGTETSTPIDDIITNKLAELLIPENAKESLNTLQEIAAWIQDHPDSVTAMNLLISNIETNLNNLIISWDNSKDTFALKGNLYEDDGHGNQVLKTIIGGHTYAETLEEVNILIGQLSFAQNVEDNAEQNVIVDINGEDQEVTINGETLQFKNEHNELVNNIKLIAADYDTSNRTISLGFNTDALETIANYTMQTSINSAITQSKAYTDSKLKWNKI